MRPESPNHHFLHNLVGKQRHPSAPHRFALCADRKAESFAYKVQVSLTLPKETRADSLRMAAGKCVSLTVYIVRQLREIVRHSFSANTTTKSESRELVKEGQRTTGVAEKPFKL